MFGMVTGSASANETLWEQLHRAEFKLSLARDNLKLAEERRNRLRDAVEANERRFIGATQLG